MTSDASSGLLDRATIVVRNSLAARQWEAWLATRELAASARAWLTPPVTSYRAFAESLVSAGDPDQPLPITASQANAIWRAVIADSAAGAELIGHGGAARWAAEAWELLLNWQIDPRRERAAAGQADYRAFLDWCARYRTVLDDHGWIDSALIDATLAAGPLAAPKGPLVLAELDRLPPARAALRERLAAADCEIHEWSAPGPRGAAARVRLADAADELRCAAAWAAAKLEHAPAARVALVVPGLAERHADLERTTANLALEGEPMPIWHGGAPLAAQPLIGAALDGIEVALGSTGFETFSRWLRSPFFAAGAAERASRAKLEAALRLDMRIKLPLGAALRDANLRERLRREAPAVELALDRAQKELEAAARATPSRWARGWQRALTALGWTPPFGADDPSLADWHGALDELARLTPIVGEVSAARALEELERVLDRPRAAALPLRGIHAFSRIEDVGPGYAGVWLAGFTDAAWPPPAQLNPLLPRALQRARGMPNATPAEASAAAARTLARVRRLVPDVVASWPNRVFDYEAEPSPAIRDWAELDPRAIAPPKRARSRPTASRETIADPAPPWPQAELRGGAGLLGLQARCPIRAFCEHRLGARSLEPMTLGLSSRVRGIVTHRALELLLAGEPTQAELETRRAAVAAQVERALAEQFRGARAALNALFDLEHERMTALLTNLLDLEARRAPFRVEAVERRRVVRIGDRQIEVRVDRLDRLADGSLVIIDYKTGDRAPGADWLKDRLRDAQVPLYAAYSDDSVAAVAVARLRGREASFRGLWEERVFPNKTLRLPDGRTWLEQLARWRAQVEQLVAELTAGDTRLLLADVTEAERDYAPLTRVAEQLGLRSGGVQRW
jgi:probable DNA repair protein